MPSGDGPSAMLEGQWGAEALLEGEGWRGARVCSLQHGAPGRVWPLSTGALSVKYTPHSEDLV